MLLILQVGDVTLVARDGKCYLYDFFTINSCKCVSIYFSRTEKISDFVNVDCIFMWINISKDWKHSLIYCLIAMWIVKLNFDVSVYLQKCRQYFIVSWTFALWMVKLFFSYQCISEKNADLWFLMFHELLQSKLLGCTFVSICMWKKCRWYFIDF